MLQFWFEGLFEYFCSFLSYRETLALLSCAKSLSENWLQRMRQIELRDEDAFHFFVDCEFRTMILSFIKDPRKQLHIKKVHFNVDAEFGPECNILLRGFHCPGFKLWRSGVDFFTTIVNNVPAGGVAMIDSLLLYCDRNKPLPALPDLTLVQHSLRLHWLSLSTTQPLVLSPTLKELELYQCKFTDAEAITLPVLPQLQKLEIMNSLVRNLSDFYYVQHVILTQLTISSLPASLSRVPRLSISHCPALTDLTVLQENQEITIDDCTGIADVSKCFAKAAKISLRFLRVNNHDVFPDNAWADFLHVDLAYYQHCKEFSLTVGHQVHLYGERLASTEDTISPLLSVVTLHGLNDFVPLGIFKNVQKLQLLHSEADFVFEGLEYVHTVILRGLWELSSLAGLGLNQKVEIMNCPAVTDFSPLRFVKTVKIDTCRGFANVCEVDHVRNLTIRDCASVTDVSALGQVTNNPSKGEEYPMQSLTIQGCQKLRSVVGLEAVIPRVTVTDCRNIRKYAHPQFRTVSGQLQTSGIFSLSDNLLNTIFVYLESREIVQFLSSTTYLFHNLMKRHRTITISRTFQDFFTVPGLAGEVLEKIADPMQQLRVICNISYSESRVHSEDILEELPLKGFQKLKITNSLFYFLCSERGKQQPTEDWFVQELTLLDPDFDGAVFFDGSRFLPYLYKAKQKLSVERVTFESQPVLLREHFAPTLRELTILNLAGVGDENSITLPVLPQLERLKIRNSQITNLNDFHYLKELTLERLDFDIHFSVEAFSAVRSLSLTEVDYLSDLSPLQQNEVVEIIRCPKIRNFSHCFPKVKKLTIELSANEEDDDEDQEVDNNEEENMGDSLHHHQHDAEVVALDLSHYPELEEFSLMGVDLPFATALQAAQLCSTDCLPPSLKTVTISDLPVFCNTKIYHTVHTLTLSRCPNVESVEGLGSVKVLFLSDLDNLSSLQGLTQLQAGVERRNQDVTIRNCRRITDFSPLRTVPKVMIISCPGLRKGQELEGVQDLTLLSCPSISDISMLIHAKKLKVIECQAVKKLGQVAEIVSDFTHEQQVSSKYYDYL